MFIAYVELQESNFSAQSKDNKRNETDAYQVDWDLCSCLENHLGQGISICFVFFIVELPCKGSGGGGETHLPPPPPPPPHLTSIHFDTTTPLPHLLIIQNGGIQCAWSINQEIRRLLLQLQYWRWIWNWCEVCIQVRKSKDLVEWNFVGWVFSNLPFTVLHISAARAE